jgi:hypothetical protein
MVEKLTKKNQHDKKKRKKKKKKKLNLVLYKEGKSSKLAN